MFSVKFFVIAIKNDSLSLAQKKESRKCITQLLFRLFHCVYNLILTFLSNIIIGKNTMWLAAVVTNISACHVYWWKQLRWTGAVN